MGKDEPPEEKQKPANEDDLQREWEWIKKRGRYIDNQIPKAPENEFEKIWERVRKEREK